MIVFSRPSTCTNRALAILYSTSGEATNGVDYTASPLSGALQIPAGWVVDRYGVKWPYALSFLFWCVASAGTALAGSVAQLIALRILLGMGESVVAIGDAIGLYDRWLEDPRVDFIAEPRGVEIAFHHALKPVATKAFTKVLTDCYLAAVAESAGATLDANSARMKRATTEPLCLARHPALARATCSGRPSA